MLVRKRQKVEKVPLPKLTKLMENPGVNSEVHEKFKLLEETEGFAKLSTDQKRAIKATLYIQSRDTKTDSGVRKNRHSNNLVYNYYCHVAVYNLEQGATTAYPLPKLPDDFFEGSYEQYQDIDAFKYKLEEVDFPSVVHVSANSEGTADRSVQHHSFVVLGHTKNGEILFWDKSGKGDSYPFRVDKIEKIFETYPIDEYYLSVRPLKIKE